jgi:hypothetical protein
MAPEAALGLGPKAGLQNVAVARPKATLSGCIDGSSEERAPIDLVFRPEV